VVLTQEQVDKLRSWAEKRHVIDPTNTLYLCDTADAFRNGGHVIAISMYDGIVEGVRVFHTETEALEHKREYFRMIKMELDDGWDAGAYEDHIVAWHDEYADYLDSIIEDPGSANLSDWYDKYQEKREYVEWHCPKAG